MATRPVFVPTTDGNLLVRERDFEFQWNPGFSPTQKKKNVLALHLAANTAGLSPLLEVSTKSEDELGANLSAFRLRIHVPDVGEIPLENAFQGGKVFRDGGPFIDLYRVQPKEARRDPRLSSSGPLSEFRFDGESWPLEPRTVFYDWLYMKAIYPRRDSLRTLERYDGFTDIEFNPKKSVNCQARACAAFVALMRRALLEEAMSSRASFVRFLQLDALEQPNASPIQQRLL